MAIAIHDETTAFLTLVDVPVDRLVASTVNPRSHLDGGAIDAIAASVKEVGILEPLVVAPADADGVHEIIAGHHRHAAARKVGLGSVPCIVRDDLDGELGVLLAMIVENTARADLDPVDEGDGYARLVGLGMTQRQIAEAVGRSQSHVSKRMALGNLTKPARDALTEGSITIADAEALTRLEDQDLVARAVAAPNPTTAINNMLRDQEAAAARKVLIDQVEAAGARLLKDNERYRLSLILLDSPEGAELAAITYDDKIQWFKLDTEAEARATQQRDAVQKKVDAEKRKREKAEQLAAATVEARHRHIHSILNAGRFDTKTATAHIIEIAGHRVGGGILFEDLYDALAVFLGIDAEEGDDVYDAVEKALTEMVLAGGVKRLKAVLAGVLADVESQLRWRTDRSDAGTAAHYAFLLATGYVPAKGEWKQPTTETTAPAGDGDDAEA